MRFADAMAARTDDELIEVVRGPEEDWEADAVEAAKAELAKRGVEMSAQPVPVVDEPDFPLTFDPSSRALLESKPAATTPKASMVCPYCRTAMTAGKIEVHGVRRYAQDATFFRADSGGEKEDILEQTTRDAYQCGECSTLIIKGRFASERSPQHPYRE